MMTVQASYLKASGELKITAASALSPGEVLNVNGQAAVVAGVDDIASGAQATLYTGGQFRVQKDTSTVLLPGQPVWWDQTNEEVCHECSATASFYLGVNLYDQAASDATCTVDLNAAPCWHIHSARDDMDELETLGLGIEQIGGYAKAAFDAVNEAATAAVWPEEKTVAVTGDWIFYGVINIVANGDAAAFDLNFGMANETHATNFDSVAEQVTIHIDGNATNITAESDDGTTEVAATDTTIDFTAGTPFLVQIDGRDPASVKIYIDGARVLSGSTFVLTAATGPLFPILYMEKSTDDTAAEAKAQFGVQVHQVLTA